MRRIPALLLSLTVLGLAPSALADSKVEEARSRFQRGVELYREGSFDAALAEFNKAYDLAPNYRVLYNMAQVQSERHDYVAALKLLEKYLAEGGSDVAPERKESVLKELATLRGRVAELTVKTEVEGAELFVDGVSSGTTPLAEPVLISAGVRQVQLRKTGYEPASKSLTVAGGEDVSVEFDLKALPESGRGSDTGAAGMQPVDSTPIQDPSLDLRGSGKSKAPMWITLITTGLFAGGAVTFAVLTREADDKLDKELNTFPADPSRVASARDDVKRNALLTDGFTAAAVISGGLFVYFAISTSGSSAPERNSAKLHSTKLRVVPSPTSLHVLGNF